MERYYVNKTNKGLAWFLVVIGGVLVIFGLVLLLRFLVDDTQTEFSILNIILYLLQGVMLGILGAINLRSAKYYLEWNENEVRYYLPGTRSVEVIQIGDVEEVEVRLFEIRLRVGGEEKSINLENVQFKEIRRIKEKFEVIKTSKANL